MYHFRVQSPCTATQQRMLTCLNRGLLWKGGWLEQRTTYRQVEVTVDGAFNAFHYGVIVASSEMGAGCFRRWRYVTALSGEKKSDGGIYICRSRSSIYGRPEWNSLRRQKYVVPKNIGNVAWKCLCRETVSYFLLELRSCTIHLSWQEVHRKGKKPGHLDYVMSDC